MTVPLADLAGNDSFGDDGDLTLADDLVNDVKAAINKALAQAGLSFGFFDGAGQLSTGLIAVSGKTADDVPLTAFFPNDAEFTVRLPAEIIVTGITRGVWVSLRRSRKLSSCLHVGGKIVPNSSTFSSNPFRQRT